MTVQTTSNLSNSIRAQYIADYIRGAMLPRLYDQFSTPIGGISMAQAMQGSSVVIPFLYDLEPATTAISETADITPVVMTDGSTSVSVTSRDNAIQWSEKLDLTAYTNYGAERFYKLGQNQMESIELLAMQECLEGSLVNRAAARASLNACTSGHRLSDADVEDVQAEMASLRVPAFAGTGGAQSWAMLLHPYPFHDLRESGNIDSVGIYQNQGIALNWELGKLGPFRLIVNADAKTLYGAGIARTAGSLSEALATAVAAGAKTTVLTTGTHVDDSLWINFLDGVETSTTFYPKNEHARYVSGTLTNTITFVGTAEDGGLRFAHAATTTTVNNSDDVFPVVYGGPQSLVKLYAPEVGEFGEVVGPEEGGLLHQFRHIGWKWYGGYARFAENRIIRGEYPVSFQG